MNLLREEFCKETNTPMGLDDVYNYVKWLENKLQQEKMYSEEEVLDILNKLGWGVYVCYSGNTPISEWMLNAFEQLKKK